MKKIFYVISITAFLAACNDSPVTEVTNEQTVPIDTIGTKYIVDTNTSVFNWQGSALSYGHNGTIRLSEGSLIVKEGILTAGSFTIDMKSIKNINLTDSARNALLVGHLNDTDFFSTKLFPTGRFEITNINPLTNDTSGNTHIVSGNLTLKGQTKNITFSVRAIISEDSVLVTGTVMVNRLDWGIKYGSTTAFPSLKAKLKDNAIKDEFKVSISLNARKG